jgi:hypothetical protein
LAGFGVIPEGMLYGTECEETLSCFYGQWESPVGCGNPSPYPPSCGPDTPPDPMCNPNDLPADCVASLSCVSPDSCTCYTCQDAIPGTYWSASPLCDGGRTATDAATDADVASDAADD